MGNFVSSKNIIPWKSVLYKVTQTAAASNGITSIIKSFFRFLKRGSFLKKSGTYKEKGSPVLDIFRKLFEPGLHS